MTVLAWALGLLHRWELQENPKVWSIPQGPVTTIFLQRWEMGPMRACQVIDHRHIKCDPGRSFTNQFFFVKDRL